MPAIAQPEVREVPPQEFFPTNARPQARMGLSQSLEVEKSYGANKIVEAHGGEIWAESRPQGGVVFRIRLPLMQ